MLQEVVTYLTIGSAIIGAFWGLFQYTKGQKLKAAELMLNMETEFRKIFPTIELIADPIECKRQVNPLLKKIAEGKKLEPDETDLIIAIDRALRFFFLCIVLERDLAVTTKALRYAYYHYMNILAQPAYSEELAPYLEKYYPRLIKWLDENKKSLQNLRATGKWKSKRRLAWSENWRRLTKGKN